MPRSTPRARAFTMVELLSVVAITSLMVATLLPVLSSAKGASRRVLCLSNQRQQGMGWFGYTSDFRQIPGLNANEGTYGGKPWGMPYFYGGITLYVADSAYPGIDYLGLMNMGYTVPYVLDGTGFGNMSN